MAWLDFPCLIVSVVISLILVVPLMFALRLGVGWFADRIVEWSGPFGARLFVGLIGVAMFGLGSKALFAVFTRGPIVASKPATVLASLFFILVGLGMFLLAVAASDTRGF